jgi:hypothetical protein
MAACEAARGLGTLGTRDEGEQSVWPEAGGPSGVRTLTLPTREFIDQKWVTQNADWVSFPTVADCFVARMATLEHLAPEYTHYAAALAARTPEEYVTQVSLSWSTDPQRATKCVETYRAHREVFPQTTSALVTGDALFVRSDARARIATAQRNWG